MLGHLIWTAAMSVTEEREALLNEIYDTEHVPALLQVPGVAQVRRYRRVRSPGRRYLAVYEIDDPGVPTSEGWLRARDLGRWPSEVRPWTSGLVNGLYEWRAGAGGESRTDAARLHLHVATRGTPAAERFAPAVESFAANPRILAVARYVELRTSAELLIVGASDDLPAEDLAPWPADEAAVEAFEPAGLGAAG